MADTQTKSTNPTGIYRGRYPKKSDPKSWKQSAYYWWWQFLKRNDEYVKCCEKKGKGRLANLYADFGDVRSDDFWEWWGYREKKGQPNRGELLFKEKAMPTVKVLKSQNEWDDDLNKKMYMVLAVNLDTNERTLRKLFAQRLLKMRKDNGIVRRRGRISMGDEFSTAKYKIAQNYNIPNLQRVLKVYDAWVANKQAKDKKLPQYKLAFNVGFKPPAIVRLNLKDPSKTYTVKAGDWDEYTWDELNEVRNVLDAGFTRFLREAKQIIANTSKGQFPLKR
jgi:hypothetical protein